MRPNLIAPRVNTVGGASTGAILAASSGPDRLLKIGTLTGVGLLAGVVADPKGGWPYGMIGGLLAGIALTA